MQTRAQIGPETIKEAATAAAVAASTAEINDVNDTQQPYLTLRQRGKKVSWLCRAFGKSARLGGATGQHRDPEYLGLREAREAARLKYHDLAAQHGADPAPAPAWTWADLDREFQQNLTQPRLSAKRIKPPSKGTMDDVRLMFAKPAIAALGPTALTALTSIAVVEAIDTVHNAHGQRVAAKAMAYVKSALTWALSKRGAKSGLHGHVAWWKDLRPPDPTGTELLKLQAARTKLRAAKLKFSVDHLGLLLTEHECFCAGRTANEKIGPGVRFGLWWVAFTGNRRFSTVALERKHLHQTHDDVRDGWGLAAWPPEMMKGKSEFQLPLPPAVLSIANGAIADWTRLVSNEHGDMKTKWVFASTRRTGRILDNEDVATFPNSLNAHLRALRGDKAGFNAGTNSLGDLPWFSLHLVRSVAGNYLDNASGVPKAAISAMLSHADGDGDDKLAPTTQAHYVDNQKLSLKAQAMEAWSEALCRAVEKAGGKLPAPRETARPSKVKPAKAA
jgi:hypothetical protein